MAICSVSRILESASNSHGLTRSLGELQLWRRDNGEIEYYVGNSVVIFKIRYRGEWRAMRCYIRGVENLEPIYGDKFLSEELYVYTGSRSGRWIDVVLERWVDGITLKRCVEKAIECGDRATLQHLADSFDLLARELLSGDWAHGDLTAENILVTPEMKLQLIDFDGKFLPEFKGRLSPEIGTAAYQPPSRGAADFDVDIDDFSIALISTALRALSIDMTLYHKYQFYDGLIFSPSLIAQGECHALEECINLFLSHNRPFAYRIATLLKIGSLRIKPLAEIFKTVGATHQITHPLHLIMKYGYVGYATEDEVDVIPAIYDNGLEFHEEVVMVQLNDKWLAIDPHGRVIKSFDGYQNVKSIRNGKVRLLKDNIWLEIPFD